MADTKAPIFSRIKNFALGSRNRVIVFLAFIIVIAAAVYFFLQYQQTQSLLKNPSQASDAEAKVLVAEVGKLIELPTNENPTIATVSDITKLVDQPFFAKAKNGDRVLVYAQNKMLVLYRPSANKIITVGTTNNVPLTTSQNTQPAESSPTTIPTPTAAPVVSVVIFNGTGTTGLAKSASQKISTKFPNDKVSTADAANSDYKKTVVIDLSNSNAKAAADLASAVGGQVSSTFPASETKPNGDIVIILGADYTGN